MNIGQIAGMAKMLFPKFSAQIDQAQQLAGQFQASPAGVQQLMQQYGKSQDDLNKALAMLNNSAVGGVLNRIQPGIVDQLKAAGQTLSGMPVQGAGTGQQTQGVTSSLDALRARLGKL